MMMARNEAKMKEKIKQLKKAIPNKNIKFKYIVADFSELTSVD